MAAPLDIMKITAQIVCAHVSTALVGTEELPALVGKVFDVLNERAKPVGDENRGATPAYDVSRSVTDDAIYSLIDGRPYKSLTTHLTARGINPHQYRNMFGLPSDYPMVAPNYSKIRTEISRKIGLGRYSDKNMEKP